MISEAFNDDDGLLNLLNDWVIQHIFVERGCRIMHTIKNFVNLTRGGKKLNSH